MELSPADSEYAYRLGKAYLRLSQWAHERIQAIDPGAARLSQALGREYLEQGRADLAEAAFEKALRRDATLADVHLSLARIYLADGRLDEAARAARAGACSDSKEARAVQAASRPRARAPTSLALKDGIDAEIGVAVRGVDSRWPAGVCSSSAVPPGRQARSNVDARAGDPGNSAARRRAPAIRTGPGLGRSGLRACRALLADAIERQPKSANCSCRSRVSS